MSLPTDPQLQHPSGCKHQKLCQHQNLHHGTAHPGQALGKGTQAQCAHKSSAGILVQSRRPIDSGALIGLHCSNTDLNYSRFSFFHIPPSLLDPYTLGSASLNTRIPTLALGRLSVNCTFVSNL